MNAFQAFIVWEIIGEPVHIQALFDEPVVTEELVIDGAIANPQLFDELEVFCEYFEYVTGAWFRGDIFFCESFCEHMEAWIMLIFQAGFAQFCDDILRGMKMFFVFMKEFPYFCVRCGPAMESYNFFDDSDPSVASIIASCEGSTCESLTIVHFVFVHRSFEATICAYNRMICIDNGIV